MAEHTTAKLAKALEQIPGVPADMIKRATDGYYHAFLSPLAMPEVQLVADLRELASRPATPRNSRPMLRELAQQVINDEFDATKEESDAWAASPEGRETFALLTGGQGTVTLPVPPESRGNPPGDGGPLFAGAAPDADAAAVKACADLVGRTGATSFECGYLNDDVPADQAGWYATAVFKGARITAEDQASPAAACAMLAARLLSGGQCQHCHKLITLSPLGAVAHDVTLLNGKTWTAAEQAAAGLCYWQLNGDRWERGCTTATGPSHRTDNGSGRSADA